MSFMDIFKVSSIKEENERLRLDLERAENELASTKKRQSQLLALFNEVGAGDAIKLKDTMSSYQQQIEASQSKLNDLEQKNAQKERLIKEKVDQLIVLDEELLLESFALYRPKFSFTSSAEYKDRLDEVREKQKNLIKDGKAVTANDQWTVNGSAVEGRKMVSDMKKLLLRSFNNECDYCVDNVKFNNIENYRSRIEKSFDAAKKLGRILNAEITGAYKKLKLDELDLSFEYQLKKQEEKEELKRIREEERERQKLEQEIQEARKKIAKEKKHFSTALTKLTSQLEGAETEGLRHEIEEKIAEIQQSLHELDNEEKEVDYREKNAKAGYIYIISNVGSFGENVFKIGMTRRLDPFERVFELGDASVPFVFDVHAMLFSEDAPALEAKIHARFENSRLNKVNPRKEFFRADLREIEVILRENYDRVFELTYQAPADQYRESLKLSTIGSSPTN